MSKTPNTQAQKYLFNHDFSFELSIPKEMLDVEKKQSFIEGFEAGRLKALSEINYQTHDALGEIQKSLLQIASQKEKSLKYAVSIASKVFLTLFPKYSREAAAYEVSQITMDVLSKLNENNHVRIICNPSLKNSLEDKLVALKTEVPFVLEENEAFSGSDVHIDWKTGFLFRSEADLVLHIQEILEAFQDKNPNNATIQNIEN